MMWFRDDLRLARLWSVQAALGAELPGKHFVDYQNDVTERDIRRYVASGEPRDKAGAYAIQGRAAVFVRGIAGSYSGIVGLPLYETAELLRRVYVLE